MTRQRQILVTVTYNDLGCIIDTKAEPHEEPNLQPTCNQLVTDTISRQVAIDAVSRGCKELRGIFAECEKNLNELPPAGSSIPISWIEKYIDWLGGMKCGASESIAFHVSLMVQRWSKKFLS